ncbi:hypothetical protein [Actinomadura citrea]|jgi:hypothetical protein|uniref:DUF2270 domain-containing protein n=1 Tax=Actinomadura citrea TaxID=46158 RepID=A0A7Y9GGG5_9ACTN|nr:hypothetical protein [Actinomadura citrea]NYE16067.1 hypothetical protein [Actinomadura citrea]GGT80913.1 hypothetical protein GCM10010177_44910 [Actinomadura citrea]
MAEVSEEAIRAYWKEHREQLRQCETQRSTLTNLLIVITAALSALIVQQRFSLYILPLCVFISMAGLYGAVAVSKYYERAAYHLSQARALTRELRERGVLGTDGKLVRARADHYRAFPRMHRIRLHRLWVVLHLAIGSYGLSLMLVSVVMA